VFFTKKKWTVENKSWFYHNFCKNSVLVHAKTTTSCDTVENALNDSPPAWSCTTTHNPDWLPQGILPCGWRCLPSPANGVILFSRLSLICGEHLMTRASYDDEKLNYYRCWFI
jgi:hypothetical protein